MRTISVMNQKGGVGKTTTSVNLAAGLADLGKRVCIVDLDPQAHASLHLGIEALDDSPTVYEIFAGEKTFADVRKMVNSHLWVVPSNLNLAAAELELADMAQRELLLRDAIKTQAVSELFDYIIMDCPPSLGVLTVNSLTATDEVFIPLQPHFFALQGLSKLFETTALVRGRLNSNLKVSGIVMCLYESGTRLAADVTDDLNNFLEHSTSRHALGECENLPQQDPPKHQAGRGTELRAINLRLRPQLSRSPRLRRTRGRGPGNGIRPGQPPAGSPQSGLSWESCGTMS